MSVPASHLGVVLHSVVTTHVGSSEAMEKAIAALEQATARGDKAVLAIGEELMHQRLAEHRVSRGTTPKEVVAQCRELARGLNALATDWRAIYGQHREALREFGLQQTTFTREIISYLETSHLKHSDGEFEGFSKALNSVGELEEKAIRCRDEMRRIRVELHWRQLEVKQMRLSHNQAFRPALEL